MNNLNAEEVLKNIEELLKEAEENKRIDEYYPGGYYRPWLTKKTRFIYPKWKIREVYNRLGIFDWWNNELSVSQLKQMRSFILTAIKLGFTGYVCFKVGATGCSHGMWAHKNESTTGYSPDGACLFHSFRSGDNYWDYCNDNNEWMGNREKWEFTLKEVKAAIAA